MEHEQPPIALRPRHIFLELRLNEILEAKKRYKEYGKKIPQEWDIEYKEITDWLEKYSVQEARREKYASKTQKTNQQ